MLATNAGSGDLRSGKTARLNVDGNATVDLYCLRKNTHPGVEGAYQSFDLSHVEAKQVGIGTPPRSTWNHGLGSYPS
jgi:hypothetical protein